MRYKEARMKYKLHYFEDCYYEVEADSEDKALAIDVPKMGHTCGIEVVKPRLMEECPEKEKK